jgi:hypothetical protein
MTAREWVARYGDRNRALPREALDESSVPIGPPDPAPYRGTSLVTGTLATGGRPNPIRLVRTLVRLVRVWRAMGEPRRRTR